MEGKLWGRLAAAWNVARRWARGMEGAAATAATVVVCLALALGVALAAHGRGAPPARAHQARVLLGDVATATATAAPTDTPTPAPQPTDTPVPAPTATPAPSWQLVGTYSGSAAGAFATFDNTGSQVRVDWTCQDTVGLPTWQIAFGFSDANGNSYAGSGEECQPGQTSGSFPFSGLPRGTLMVDASDGCSGTGCPPMGPWTAAVYVWE